MDKERLRRERNLNDAELAEVITRATRLQREEREASINEVDVAEVATELDIAPGYVEKALAQLEAERQEAARRAALQKVAVRKGLLVGAGALVVLTLGIAGGAWSRGRSMAAAAQARAAAETRLNGALARQAELIPPLVALSGGDPKPLLERARDVLQAPRPERRLEAATTFDAAVAEALARLPAQSDPAAEQRRLSLQHEITGARNRITVERARYEQAVAAERRTGEGVLAGVARALGWP